MSFSPLSMMLAVGLSSMVFIMLRYVPSIPTLLNFYPNGCLILSKAFSASIEMIMWFLFFNLLMWCITLFDLWILSHPFIPGINPTWSWYMILWIYCWIPCANFLLRIFTYLFIRDLICNLFLGYLCLVLVWLPHRMSLEEFLLLQFFIIVWEGWVLTLL